MPGGEQDEDSIRISRGSRAARWRRVEPDRRGAGNAWVGNADGAITAASVTVDAIWLYRAQTSYDVNVYVDEVQIRN
jgi:hypothetical protein